MVKMRQIDLTVLEAATGPQKNPALYIFRRDDYRLVTDFDTDDLEADGHISVMTGDWYYAMRKSARPFFVKV